ncbi:MmgE/PrpD family protein [Ottowia thiooxydans]|uniref:MmgE/PrpD family protein n=1 Tax=Ottowia thiooxydans TaxID=219182 RepID=UPI0003F53F26|nr:MmgE/PrpD family protein [Ottowia thiooxydans]
MPGSTAPSSSRVLARFAHGLALADVPAEVQHLARLHLADAIGVGLGAAAVPRHRRWLETVLAEGAATGSATALGFDVGVPATLAAMMNGTGMHSLEFDDTHMASIVHGSAVIVPAALASVEVRGASLDELVRLVVIGWEALVRIGEASPGGFQRRGFQVTSVAGVVVAAMIACVARGASVEETVAAMGIAGSQAGGIFEFLTNGSNVKALHPGWAAHAGLWAATCAAGGMTGPETVLEGRFGLYNTYADDAQGGERLAGYLQDLGRAWRLSDAAFKFYPCCHYIHPYLEIAHGLREQIHSPDTITSVHCRVAPGAATVICEPWSAKQTVRTGNEAKYSLPYCMARILLGRAVDIPAMTGDDVDAEAVALSQRIHWSPWDDSGFPQRFGADVQVILADGRELTQRIDQVQGSAQRPAGDTAVQAKFMANASATLGKAASVRAWDTIVRAGTLDTLQKALRSRA